MEIHSELQLVKRQFSHCYLVVRRQFHRAVQIPLMLISHIKDVELLLFINLLSKPLLIHINLVIQWLRNWFWTCPFLRFIINVDKLFLLKVYQE